MPAAPNRVRVVTRAVVALVLLALFAPPATAEPKTPPPATKAAAAQPADFSTDLPRTIRDEVVGDFLGLGYQQRMRAENTSLNIYDPPALGGRLRQSTPLDLSVPTGANLYYRDNGGYISPWAEFAKRGSISCGECFQGIDNTYHLASIYLAVLGDSLYISGTKGSAIDAGNNSTFPPAGESTYRNLLYRVPLNGTCASESCAWNVASLPAHYSPGFPEPDRAIGTTALAAGYSGGNPFVAAGLTDGGVLIFKGDLTSSNGYTGMATGDGSQTPTSALAFDPSGSGYLAVGVVSIGYITLTLKVNPDGTPTGTLGYLALGGTNSLLVFPLSAVWGRRGPGLTPAVAWGFNNGTIGVADRDSPNSQIVGSGSPGIGVSVLNAVARPDDSGIDDFAVAMQTTSDVAGPLVGTLLKWPSTGGINLTTAPLSVDATGAAVNQIDRDAFQRWYPGFKQGRFSVTNTSQEQITISLQTRSIGSYGCWWTRAWSDADPFPSADGPLTLDPGETSGPWVMGALTAGSDGACGGDGPSGEWRGYLSITPVNRPGDVKIVNLWLKRNWTLDVDSDQGNAPYPGSTTVTAERLGGAAAFGNWQLSVGTPTEATPIDGPPQQPSLTAPQVTASVLTTPLRGRATVYRFDVAPVPWQLPASAVNSVQAVLDPLRVEGTTNSAAGQWTTLGYLMPVTNLSRQGQRLTIGGGTFFWENTGTGYTQVRVRAGTQTSDPVSAPVVLSTLKAPTTPSSTIKTVSLQATANQTNGVATPIANGVDQSQLAVTITAGADGATLPPTDPAYQTVYYRTSSNVLVTNLYGVNAFGSFVGVQPSAGATSGIGQSNGSTSTTQTYDYLSTTSQSTQNLSAYVGVGSSKSQPVTVNAGDADVAPPAGSEAGAGFPIESCADFDRSSSCAIATVTSARPALYQAGPVAGLPLIGAQLRYRVGFAFENLPMEWSTKVQARKLQYEDVTATSKLASIQTSMWLPDDLVDTILVSHGQSVPVTEMKVGGG